MKSPIISFTLVFIVLLGFALLVGHKEWRTRTGYCQAESRYLSEQELIRGAIEQLIREDKKKYMDLGAEDAGNYIFYRDTNHFFDENPACCDDLFGTGWRGEHRITDTHLRRYEYSSDVYFRHLKTGDKPFMSASVSADECGKDYVWSFFGATGSPG